MTLFYHFSVLSFSFLHPTAPPHQYLFIVVSLYLFAPAPHLFSWRKALLTMMLPLPTTQPPLPLVSAPLVVCLHLPPFPLTVPPPPPIANIGMCPGLFQTLKGLPITGLYVFPMPLPRPPLFFLQILTCPCS